ncbi:MAG: sugar ABC transporter permease [Verrucomicrobiota bacterium]|jgi:ABC-type sugar transport system permease subunit|nr:sugar ABC transporter permease [Verrucomicrobiota bacterium]MDP7048446.1 sugar ABC transporter permease [Verrucomicrobiota bacterium]
MPAANQRTSRARWTPFLLLLPFILFLMLFWLIPLVGGVKMSLQANGLGQAEYVGLSHYMALANDERYITALRNSFTYTLASIVVIVPLALWLAHLLRATFRRLRPMLTFALLLPALTPPSVLAVLFLMVFHGKNGLLNQLFVMPLGLERIDWLKDPDFILIGLVLQTAWRWTGFMTFFILAGMEGIPRVFYEAARLATASRWRQFWHVTVPQLRPVLLFVAVYLVVDGFSLFSGAFMLLGGSGGTADAGLLTITYVFQKSRFFEYGTASAISVSLLPLMLLLVWGCLFLRRRTA